MQVAGSSRARSKCNRSVVSSSHPSPKNWMQMRSVQEFDAWWLEQLRNLLSVGGDVELRSY